VREVFRRFWPHLRPLRRWLIPALAFVALAPAAEAANLIIYKVLIDNVLVPGDFSLLPWIAAAYVGVMLFDAAVSFGDDCLSEWVAGRFLLSLRTALFRHLHSLSLDFFERRRLGDMVSRLTSDVSAIEKFVLSGVADTVGYCVRILFFVGILFYLQWQLAFASLFVVPLFWVTGGYFSRRIKQASREERRRSGTIASVAEESLSNAALVQAYNRQETEVARFEREGQGNFAASMALIRLKASFTPIVDFIQLAGMLVVMGMGAWALAEGRLTVGGLLVFIALLGRLYAPIKGLSRIANTVYTASAGAERIIEFLDQRPSVVDRPAAVALDAVRGEVRFEAVEFAYPGLSEPTLSGISFSVAPGETVALVGPSGAGKSTIAKLLMRFYDPGAGRVTIDGYDLRDIELRSLRDNVTVLLQEALVFDGTIRENIAYGKPGATEDEITAAAKAADAHGFILSLPEGYATQTGQKGRRLSGGQRQRIAMARAMIRNASILILDEPTTGLDAASSERILAPLRRLMAGRTTIVVSHNLLTVRDADRIVMLEDGRITGQGTHADLLAANSAYNRLFRLHHETAPPATSPRPRPGGEQSAAVRKPFAANSRNAPVGG
jgi:subfamily B ATP-binding cassette protein MsbA